MAANSEPAISNLQLDISNFSHILRIRASDNLFSTNLKHLAGYKGVAECCSSFFTCFYNLIYVTLLCFVYEGF